MCLEGDFLIQNVYIKVKNEYKRLNNAKKRTNYLVCNIEGTDTEVNPFVADIPSTASLCWQNGSGVGSLTHFFVNP